ncbi:hypothetical protein [Gordonia sp. (in: high G+C Gram-positive bacteria)]|uniref:hypothetical protein n=1 Tax=Gordonia sp. (in: high G+C Gram-positive bacteria) TaxID=84139 RepID=UPI0039E69BA1
MIDLVAQIDDRGRTAPGLTALRWGGEAVAHGVLRERVIAFDRVVSDAGLSETAAVTAALLSLMPESVRPREPRGQAELVADALAWLGRDRGGRTATLSSVV